MGGEGGRISVCGGGMCVCVRACALTPELKEINSNLLIFPISPSCPCCMLLPTSLPTLLPPLYFQFSPRFHDPITLPPPHGRVHIMREESKILQHRQNIIARADASRSKAARSAKGGAGGAGGADSGEEFPHSEAGVDGTSSSSAFSYSSNGSSGSNIDTSSQTSGASASATAAASSSSAAAGVKGAKGRGLANAIRSPI